MRKHCFVKLTNSTANSSRDCKNTTTFLNKTWLLMLNPTKLRSTSPASAFPFLKIMLFKRFWFAFNLQEGWSQPTRIISRREKRQGMLIGLRSRNNYISDDNVVHGRREGKSRARQTIQSRYQQPLFSGKSTILPPTFSTVKVVIQRISHV